MKKEELLSSKYFCMMPWVHMHLWPNGNAFPCCIWDSSKPIGKYDQNTSLEDIWNGDKMKEIRRSMMKGEPIEACKRCYVLQENKGFQTLRQTSIDKYSDKFYLVEQTREDGHNPNLNMSYLDIRFSNACNLRCQTCGPELSSAWYEDQVKAYGKPSHEKILQVSPSEKFWGELEPLLDDVRIAYFAGGEPLICDEHYRILDYWKSKNHLDVAINYTTNFTLLTHNNLKVLDYWKLFKNVSVSASLDDSWERGEYLRKGTSWKNVIRNRELMLRECPDIHFEITPTISAYNVFHFPEFHYEWITNGLLKPNALRLNILTHQEFQSVKILPAEMKETIKEKYLEYLEKIKEWCHARGEYYYNVESGYNAVIDFMMSGDDRHLIPEFLKRASEIDKVRGERLFKIYPELRFLLFEVPEYIGM